MESDGEDMTEELDHSAKVILEGAGEVKTPDDANALLARLMHANLMDYQNTTGTLIESYQRQIADLEAELNAVREGVSSLFYQPYMPTESMVKQVVFYPSKALVEKYRKAKKDGM